MRRSIFHPLVVALSLSLLLGGCSFVLVKKPPVEQEPMTWPRCTEHYFWQIVDGTMAVLALTAAVSFADSNDELAEVGTVVEGGIAAGFGLSALLGLPKTSQCREARAAYEKAAEEGR
jgi:hypothetical protein